ncbi:MAG TPA: hypothetical protein VHR66_29865, partial [Gemmataceae bacterium]|nr:hypothetical protein [Gemmataceae bacterium]
NTPASWRTASDHGRDRHRTPRNPGSAALLIRRTVPRQALHFSFGVYTWTKPIHQLSFYALWQDVIDNPHKDVWIAFAEDKDTKELRERKVSLSFVKKDVSKP